MKIDMAQLSWHDALLLSIVIDRSDPGNIDTVEFLVEWTDGARSRIIFIDCYAMYSRMNFGIAAKESIRAFSSEDDGDEIRRIKMSYEKIGADIGSLRRFTLETNSTASLIAVFALSVEVISVS